MRTTTLGFVSLVFVVSTLALGCAKPPTAEIDGIKNAFEAVQTPESKQWAGRSLVDAEAAMDKVAGELKVQEDKFSLFRKYDAVKVAIADAQKAIDAVAPAVSAARNAAKEEAAQTIAIARTALAKAKELLANAPTGKGTEADLEMLKADVEGVEQAVEETQKTFDAGLYLEVGPKAKAATVRAEEVSASIEQAIAAVKAATEGTVQAQ